mmetsp:Transcript_16164/g.46422  ORF Transcript_16164/g.46422 Transcript_16164/m.46422 type:complete len:309 (+) Transcript_16164:1423-2349(+)
MILRQQLEFGTRRVVKAFKVLPFVVLITRSQDEVPAVISFKTEICRLSLHQSNTIFNLFPLPTEVLLIGIAVRRDDEIVLFTFVVAAHDTEIVSSRSPLDAGLVVKMPKETEVLIATLVNLGSLVATQSVVLSVVIFLVVVITIIVDLDAVFSLVTTTFKPATALLASSRLGVGTAYFGLFTLGTARGLCVHLVGTGGSRIVTIIVLVLVLDAVLAILSPALEAGATELGPIISRLCTAINGLFSLGTAAGIAEETWMLCGRVVVRGSAKMIVKDIACCTNVREHGADGQGNSKMHGCDLHCVAFVEA